MSRPSILLLLGALVLLVPFAGLPSSWVRIIELLLGAGVFAVGFSLRAAEVKESKSAAPDAPAEAPAESGPATMSAI